MPLEDTATNSVVGGDTSDLDTAANDTGVDAEGQQADDEPELDDDGNPIEVDDSEEIEHDGQKYKVPRALKPLLLMQADYTKKTQDLAERSRAVEAERQALHQTSQAELDTYAFAKSLEAQLGQYERIDWDAWHENDPFAASAATSKYQVLQRQYQQATGQLSNLRSQRAFQKQQDTAKRTEEGRAVLTREVPGWNDDLKAKLITFAAGYGFDRSEVDDMETDPRVAKVLHAAFTGSETTRKAKAAQGHVAAQQAQPAAKVRAASAPAGRLDDRQSVDAWMNARNAQTRKRA